MNEIIEIYRGPGYFKHDFVASGTGDVDIYFSSYNEHRYKKMHYDLGKYLDLPDIEIDSLRTDCCVMDVTFRLT